MVHITAKQMSGSTPIVGRYDGKVVLLPNPNATGNLAAADLGSDKGDAVIWYPPDIGADHHGLDPTNNADKYHAGHIVGWASDGKAVVVIAGGGLPKGTLRYQVFQMTTDSTTGWDWVRFH